MIRKFVLAGSVAALLVAGGSAWGISANAAPQSAAETQKSEKTTTGKITAIGNSGTSFSIETNDGGSAKTMQFVLDKETQVQGQVKVGTLVSVAYRTDNGQNVAVTVTAQA